MARHIARTSGIHGPVDTAAERGGAERVPPQSVRLPWLILLAVAVAAAYHETLTWMAQQWWNDEYYGHGLLIPLVSGYLIYHQRKRLAELSRKPSRGALPLLIGSLLLHVGAQLLGVHFLSGFALVGTLYALVLWLWGRAVGRALLFPLAFLLFMVPLSRILVEKLSQPMQLFSARGAGWLLSGLLHGVQVEGVAITSPGYSFNVAIPCSGLKSLIAMSALGALFAYLVEGSPLRRVVLFLAAFPLALIANLVRIFTTVILGNSLGPAAAEGFFHSASGAFVFVVALGGLFALGGALGCRRLREDI